MYQVRKVSGEVLISFDSLNEANQFIVANWNLGPMIVVSALTEETVAKPSFLSE